MTAATAGRRAPVAAAAVAAARRRAPATAVPAPGRRARAASPARAPSAMPFYVYGIMRADDVPEKATTVCEGDLAALVEEIDAEEVKVDRKALSRHMETLRGL